METIMLRHSIHYHYLIPHHGHWGIMMDTSVIIVCQGAMSSAMWTSVEILHHVHSFMWSFHDFLCISILHWPCIIPWRMIFINNNSRNGHLRERTWHVYNQQNKQHLPLTLAGRGETEHLCLAQSAMSVLTTKTTNVFLLHFTQQNIFSVAKWKSISLKKLHNNFGKADKKKE